MVKLPTAAPRKVNNGRWAQQRRAGMALCREQGHFQSILHHDREEVIKAERLADFMEARSPMSAEMGVVLGLVQILTPDQVERLVGHVMASEKSLTLVELARADALTKHLIWVTMQRRGLV